MVDGKKYEWCPHHSPQQGKDAKKSGMYMPAPHNHHKWFQKPKEKTANWKAKQKDRRKKCKSPESTPAADSNKGKPRPEGKLTFAKSFKSALVTKVQLSDAEIDDTIGGAMKDSENIDDSEDASKE